MMLSRRNLLTTTAVAMGAAALPSASASVHAAELPPPRRLIVVMAAGGWDTTAVFDPKPGLSTIDVLPGDVTMFGDMPIYTDPSRSNVTTFFQKHAGRCAVVNGIQVQSLVHTDCAKRLLTGTASDANPDIGAIAAYELGRALPAPYLVLGPTAYTGPYASVAARTGTLTQLRMLLETEPLLPQGIIGAPARFAPDGHEQGLIRGYLQARAARQQSLRGAFGANQRRYDDFLASLMRSDTLKGFKNSFGDDFTFTLGLNEQVDLCMQALTTNLCQAVHLEQVFGQWDSHNNNNTQTVMYQDLFAGLDKLTDALIATPGTNGGATMLDETVVAVVSEMGRTPMLNGTGGKDHWPVTSALIYGAGIKGGVYGASTNELAGENIDLQTGQVNAAGQQLEYTNFVAGLLKASGVDPELYLPGREAFDAYLV